MTEQTSSRREATKQSGRTGPRTGPLARLTRRFRETVAELRKVVWPTRKQLVTYTMVVLVFVAAFVVFAASMDVLFQRLMFAVFA